MRRILKLPGCERVGQVKALLTWAKKGPAFSAETEPKIGAERVRFISSCKQHLRLRLHELKKGLLSALKLSGLP